MSLPQPLRAALLLVLLGPLSACSVLPKAEPIHIYRLPSSPTNRPPADSPRLEQTLVVDTPQADRMLGSGRIVVVPKHNRVSSYEGARWSDTAPILLRDRLVEAFRQDGRVANVISDDQRLHTDLELVSDLRGFHTEYVDGEAEVVIRLEASLVQSSSQRVLASRSFEVRQPSEDEKLDAVVAAFGQAGDDLSRQVVAWTLEQSEKLVR